MRTLWSITRKCPIKFWCFSVARLVLLHCSTFFRYGFNVRAYGVHWTLMLTILSYRLLMSRVGLVARALFIA